MGAKCAAIERNTFQFKSNISKNDFDKKYIIGKGSLGKVYYYILY